MKKYLIAFLLSLSCACAAMAVGCTQTPTQSDEQSSSNAPSAQAFSVTFEQGEGFTYDTEFISGEQAEEGSVVEFKVEKGGFYQDAVPTVYVNDIPVAHDGTGLYKLTVKEDVIIRVGGMRKDISDMGGTGSFETPFVVTKPIDLVYIAEQVNKGNPSYVQGAYVLAADIDCKGETLKVIGDMSTENSYFSGCFTCDYDPETGIPKEYTISNFKIDSKDSNYVGLFGAVFCDLSVTSSGLFYGIRLDNFTVEARFNNEMSESKSIFCGSLVGYGVGVTTILCDATNGELNVAADVSYFAYAGGLMGYQQAFYNEGFDYYFPSEIAYSKVDVDINIVSGMALYAGGISGFLSTNVAMMANASIHNSYATGSISGALRAGGIAGGVGAYNVVSNCYASGDVTANSTQTITEINPDDEYCHAYAGGLVGYGENDSIVHDSFHNGKLYANAAQGNAYTHIGAAVGGGDEQGTASATAQKYVELNCLSNVELSDADFFTDNLGWGEHDWVFIAGELPEINYETYSGRVELYLNLQYVSPNHADEIIKVGGKTVRTEKYFDTQTQSTSSYASVGGYFLSGDLPLSFTADNGYLSYGYFFDEACTQPVPFGYMPMKTVTLYVAFEDVTPVVGTYQLFANGTKPVSLTLTPDGKALYTDGATTGEATYAYNGEKILLEGARLARYYNGDVVIDELNTSLINDPNFDLYRYQAQNFVGYLNDGQLILFDGVYFTQDAPLYANVNALCGEFFIKDSEGTVYYTLYGNKATVEIDKDEYSFNEYDICELNGNILTLKDSQGDYEDHVVNVNDLTAYDTFKGVWKNTATVHKSFTFDGLGTLVYKHLAYEYGYASIENTITEEKVAYTDNGDGSISFVLNGVSYSASFDRDGFLEVLSGGISVRYYREYSYVGTWSYADITLQLNGIQKDGMGSALCLYDDGTKYNLFYEESGTNDYVVLFLANDGKKGDVFGYFTLNKATNTLIATLSDSMNQTSGYTQYQMLLQDNFKGEWITNASGLENVEFIFDGNGLYAHLNQNGKLVIVDGETETELTYELDSNQTGKIVYKGVEYNLAYDETLGKIVISASEVLERKDAFADATFIDVANGDEYVFDGRSTLGEGTLTVNGETTYAYTANGETVAIFDGETQIGSMARENNAYSLTLNSAKKTLYVSNEFMGNWAMANEFRFFTVGASDLNGVITANFKGYNVEMTEYDNNMLTFSYKDLENWGMPRTYYVFIVPDSVTNEDVLVLSEYASIYGSDQIICSKVSEYYGTWISVSDSELSLTFDGVNSSYANGTAKITRKGYDTLYSYNIREEGVMMWSQDPMQDRYWYYKLEMTTLDEYPEATTDKNAWINYVNNTVIIRTEVDSLFRTVATDEDGNDVFFNGEGEILVNGAVAYTYKSSDVTYNTDNTITLKAVRVEDNKTYSLVIDHSTTDFKLIVKGVVEE